MIVDLKFYTKLLIRRLPIMAMLFLVCTGVAAVVAIRLPPMYSTEATLLVEGAQISLRGDVEVDTIEQLEVVQRRLLTRVNLLEIARENNVFENINEMSPDEIVEEMRKQTSVRRASGRSRAVTMEIGFEGFSPQQVAAVVNQYVTIALTANTGTRTQRTQSALSFFEQEVETLTQRLSEANNQLSEFKTVNASALPENLSFRLNRVAVLRERQQRAEQELEELQLQRRIAADNFAATGVASGPDARTAEQTQLVKLQSQLRSALAIYSEENPNVKILRQQIEALEAQVIQNDDEDVGVVLPDSLGQFDRRIAALNEEIPAISEELIVLESSIERTPSVRLEVEEMEREQANLQGLYASALQNLNQAQMNERIELSARGERITVLEPPSVPTEPSSPNRMAIIGTGVAIGTALAVGFFLLMELLNQSIRRSQDITRALEFVPLATLPRFEGTQHRRIRQSLQIASFCLVLVAVPVCLWAVDQYYLPLDILFERLRDKLF